MIKLAKINKLLALLLTTIPISIMGQPIGLGSWNIVNVKYKASKQWSGFAEVQLRSLQFYNNFHYYEYKGGVNYDGIKNIKFTIAGGSYQTYAEGGNFKTPKNNNEFRLWPQVQLTQNIGLIKIEQRYRAELRFTSNGFRNRFRYRLGLSHAFGNERKGYKPYQITANSELFFTNTQPYFERNRSTLAFGYKATKYLQWQIGYLHQFDYKINDETGRDFLQLGMYVEIPTKREK